MKTPLLSSETVHASSVAINGRAVLIMGRSGAGKSDLALRLIDRGAKLVSDDYTIVQRRNGRLRAFAPPSISGKIEVRGVGLIDLDPEKDVPVCFAVDLDRDPVRLPEGENVGVLGVSIPVIRLNGLEASAPIKVELALQRFGIPKE